MMDLFRKIFNAGIVPVVKIDSPDDAVPLANALRRGGLKVAEITFRTDAAEASIRRIRAEVPDMLVGAGTVLTTEQVDRAKAAGAEFLVSPGFNEKIVRYALDAQLPIIPGCNNPSAIEAALELGLTTLKFFPAEASGGLGMIKALCGPYTNIRFMPTGGIDENNLNTYLAFPKIIACGGSWMVKDSLIKSGRFDEIERLTRNAISKMLGLKLTGIRGFSGNKEMAKHEAERIAALFGWEFREEGQEWIADNLIVSGKEDVPGLIIGTNSVDRARYYLEQRGCKFNESTAFKNTNGTLKSIEMEGRILDFSVILKIDLKSLMDY